MTSISSSFKGNLVLQAPQQQFRSTKLPKVVCQAQKKDLSQKIKSVLGAALLATTLGLSTVDSAQADISGLTPCSQSKAFQKRQKKEVKDLQRRQKQYEQDSAPFVALQASIERTNKRFESYGRSNLLCGSDGLPHLISEPGYALRYGHAGETFIPTFVFLYIAGYIGQVGRKYLQAIRSRKNPTDAEIVIDIPFALKLCGRGLIWPADVISELRNGQLLEDDSKITISPR